MKKTAILLAAMLVLSMLTLAACDFGKNNKPCTEHTDANGDKICDNCGEKLEAETPTCEHKDENKDHICDLCEEKLSDCAAAKDSHNCEVCGKKLSDCAAAENSHNCAVCGEKLSECETAENSHNCAVCGEKLSECEAVEGSHNCSVCGAALSQCVDENGNYTCDICGGDVIPDTHEKVNYTFNISGQEATTLESDLINGKFTVVAGSEIRNREKTYTDPATGEKIVFTQSVKIGSAKTKIKIDVPGTGTLSFFIQNGSSGAATQFVTVTAPDGTVYDIEFAGTDGGSPVVKLDVEVTKGEWIISRGKNGGTQDVFYLGLSCVVEKSDENGFELVSEGTVDYLCGQKLDLSGLVLNATYANGKTEPLSLEDVTIDDSLVNLGQSGTYPLTISYKNYEPIVVNINVYLPVSVELDFDGTVQGSQTSAGNGTYINQSFKEVYAVGETLDLTGLYVTVNGWMSDDQPLKTFPNVSTYLVSEVDLSTAGAKTLTISYDYVTDKVSADTVIHVVDTAPSIVEDAYQVKVDADYKGTIGAVDNGYNMFTTVQQALDFLATSEAGKRKIMIIEEGYYFEKLEITIPNIHIKGVGADKVVIEWDSIYGIKDAGGFSQITDSTQTVAIRDSAYGVTIEGVTISNYWNSQERMNEAGLGIERGLALLVQADRFIMRDSALLGIQDTLELFTGRQYFENVFISGYTDFIFGTNNTTLFKNCTIHVIDTVKDDGGTAGYITAFKGSNKGASDAITYGAIFYQCKFTADEGVTEGKTAIGRTWGAYAAVAVIESELGGHISVDGYDSSNNKNKRYISMNGIHPTDSTVQFVEYNNTGAGAITSAVAGMKLLTAEEAALYYDIATIFGKNNRGVSWLDAWDPAVTEIVLDDRTYYNFDQTTSTGTSHTFDINTTIASGSTLEWEGLLISAENGKVAWNSNANSLNMKAGAFIKFTVSAGSEVTVVTYPNYNYFTLNGVGTASANMLSQHYAEETEVTLLSTGDLYIYQIIINPGEEAPAAPTLNEIKVSGMNTNYVVGDQISLDGLVVKAIYSDNSVVTVTDYTVNSDAVVNNAAGEYEVVISYGEKSATVKVTYEDPNADPEITKDTVLDFTTPEGLESVQNNPKVTINGSVRHNGAEIQITGTISFKVKAGTIVTVIPYANTSYASYKLYAEGETTELVCNGMYSMMFFEDCTVVYEGLENNYLCSISIECPLTEGKYVFGGSTVEGDVTGILESIPSMSITGTCKNHSGGAQLGADSQIIFIAPALATVTIQGFDTNYGQLHVLVDGEPVEMNASAQYVINCTSAATVIIEALNVGTETEPAYNKSYITYIDVDLPVCIEEDTTITFGSAGNYKDSIVDFSGITIGDNGGNNSQVKNGSFSFAVREGAKVTVHGYSGYTSYNFGDGDITFEGLTDEYFTYEAWNDCVITISHTDGNNYFHSIEIEYPVVFEETTTIDLSATGANIQGTTGKYAGMNIDATNGKFADNGGGWTQVNAGTVITLNVLEGAEASVVAYSSADNFTIAVENGVCTITCVGNDYLKAITVKYKVVYSENTTIDLSKTGANIQGSAGEYEGLSVDATNGKFADNGGGWVQVNTGTTIKLNVADGAQVSVSAYSSSDNFTVAIADGVCTITCVGNDYLKSITVSY